MAITRFAPSPTGELHIGHAFAAWMAEEAAQGGDVLVRIEDIDGTRCKPDYETALLADLAWLGLSWREPVRRQSEHFADYAAALDILERQGVLYPCFCTRADIAAEMARAGVAPQGAEGPVYPGTCRGLDSKTRERKIASGATYALRLDINQALIRIARPVSFTELGAGPKGEHGNQYTRPDLAGDVVLARKDTPASYHLAVVVDDARQGVTVVTRGNDLFAATPVQRVLQELLGLPAPDYAHHRLILDPNGKKFSKRDKATTLRSLRESGASPDDIRAMVGLARRGVPA